MTAGYHQIQAGECLCSLAQQYGFADYKTIYDQPKNALLKKKRPNPNMLLEGDCVFIPDKQEKQQARATNQTHQFQIHVPTIRLRLRLLDTDDNPYANKHYVLKIARVNTANTTILSGATTAQGLIEEFVPADAVEAQLTFWLDETTDKATQVMEASPDAGKQSAPQQGTDRGGSSLNNEPDGESEENNVLHIRLAIGSLGPAEEIVGVQARLNNLGFFCGKVDGIYGPHTEQALKRFQTKTGLVPSGKPDAATVKKLQAQHDTA